MKKNNMSEARHFSLPLFITNIAVSLSIFLGLFWLIAPKQWRAETQASVSVFIITFLSVHILTAFVEFFFHRYVLHSPAIPFLSYLYKSHTLHHSLTRVRLVGGTTEGTVENKYPIIEEKQHKSSFFPWYSFAVFASLGTPVFWLASLLFPTAPVFIAGYVGTGFSLVLYETIHAVEHWSLERWQKLLDHARWGRFWRILYAFHLRHHADRRYMSNESISGFFGLPIPDWVFGTYVKSDELYRHGSIGEELSFQSPTPIWPIRMLDRLAEWSVRRQRRVA